jgi:hypothetical protein
MDPTVLEVCDMAGHAVVYRFDLRTQGWSKLDIEGSLFLVRRLGIYFTTLLSTSLFIVFKGTCSQHHIK